VATGAGGCIGSPPEVLGRVIALKRLNGERIAVNPELVERAEEKPETVITLTNGARYVVAESLDEVMEKVRHYRSSVLADARAPAPLGLIRAGRN